MHTYDGPYLADWFAISLRWLAALGITIALALSQQLNTECQALLLGIAVWNSLQSLLAVLNRRLWRHRLINGLADLVSAMAFYWFTDGVWGPVWWVGLLPMLTGSIYYLWKGSLRVALVLSVFLAILSVFKAGFPASLAAVVFVSLYHLAAGLVLGLLSRQLIRGLKTNREQQLKIKQEAEQAALKGERERMQAFYNLTTELSSTLNYEHVMNSALDLSVSALAELNSSADLLASAILLCQKEGLQVSCGRRLSPTDLRTSLPGNTGAVGTALSSAETVLCLDPASDPELIRLVSLGTCQSALVIPLRSGLNIYGVMLYAHPKPDYFNQPRREILEIISHQTVTAIQNASLYQDLESEKQRIIETQDEARKKLARDLHDGPTQSVSSIAMRLSYARKLLQSDPRATAEELVKIEEMARRTTKEIRHMLFTLRPLALESGGLCSALQMMAEKMKETYAQTVRIDVDPALVNELELNKQTVIFYLSEEAVNNARKHAQASRILVRLKRVPQAPEVASLDIIDNGIGFDVKAVRGGYEHRGSLGMVNLEERTELINGLLHLNSEPGKGTRVQVFIPLTEAAADRLHRGH